jgi:steroid 5-alpha reductase family enzyme
VSWSGLALNVAVSAAVVLVALLLVWRVGARMRDMSIIDIFWGPGFVLVALVTLAVGDAPSGRRVLLAVLVSVWGLRLGGYLAWRNLGHGEDARYQAMRRHVGDGFHAWAFTHVFLFQGLVLTVVSLPVQIGGNLTSRTVLAPQVLVGIALWAVGLGFEAIGDVQLARFKAEPANGGKVMDRGLWAWTRHPNYFGDACVWWGLWLVSINGWVALATVGSPLVMTYFLVHVSGARLTEKYMRGRPGFTEYQKRTSYFVPWPPRSANRR